MNNQNQKPVPPTPAKATKPGKQITPLLERRLKAKLQDKQTERGRTDDRRAARKLKFDS